MPCWSDYEQISGGSGSTLSHISGDALRSIAVLAVFAETPQFYEYAQLDVSVS